MDGVGADICVGNEDGELDQEDSQGGRAEFGIGQRLQVDSGAALLVGRQPLFQKQARTYGRSSADESDCPDRPGESNAWGHVHDDERKDDAADASGGACYPCCQCASLGEPVAYSGDAGIEEQRC